MWADRTNESFALIFKGVGLDFSPLHVEKALQLLALYQCREVIVGGVLDKTKQPLFPEITEHTHQFLILTAYLQSTFIRPVKLERTDVKDPDSLDLVALKECARTLGMLDEILPKLQHYPRVIVQGGFQFRLEKRLLFLVRLIRSKIIVGVEHLLISVGERVLADFEPAKQQSANTEFEMAKIVLAQMKQEYPDCFDKITIDFHNAQKKPDAVRADVDDASAQTAKMYQQKDTVLLISDQPFCQFQHESFRIPFHPTPLETIGEAASEDYNGWNFCDAFSRYMFCIARRHLILDSKIDPKKSMDIINEYKKLYTCDSSLYLNGKLRPELESPAKELAAGITTILK
ncbi:MAG: hypothetical protein K2X50_02500 [Gammaproteobacteria bacterium]|nr:hypothetical protein [Gammaproteobacteria bacterium]